MSQLSKKALEEQVNSLSEKMKTLSEKMEALSERLEAVDSKPTYNYINSFLFVCIFCFYIFR